MIQAELDDLGTLPSDKVIGAIDCGDLPAAKALCDKLAKEFVLMHVGLRKVVDLLLEDDVARFKRGQASIADRALGLIAARNTKDALPLLAEKRRQFMSLRGLLIEIETSSLSVISMYVGEPQRSEMSTALDNSSKIPEATTLPSAEIETALAAGSSEVSEQTRGNLAVEYSPELDARAARLKHLIVENERIFRQVQAAMTASIAADLASGRLQEARAALERKKKHHLALHDVIIAFLAGSFSWVYVNYGDEALCDCQYNLASGQRDGLAAWATMTAEEMLPIIAALNAQHGYTKVRIVEDEHKYSLISDPCGTGGQMQRDGLFDPPISKYARVRKPQPLTFNIPDLPTYCTHCAVWNNLAPMDWWGRPLVVNASLMRKPEDHCVLHLYKDRRFIPEEYYRSLGREKPST